jgi:hypothetical protein
VSTIEKPDLDAIHLEVGDHHSRDEGVCVMELAAWLAGRPHSDKPPCVSQTIGAFLRRWNDTLPDEPRQLLKPYALEVLNTATTKADEQERAWLATDWLVRTFTPVWLDKAGLTEHAQALRDLEALTSTELATKAKPIINAARGSARAAGDAAWAAAGDAAWAAARDAGDTYELKFKAAYDVARPLIDEAFADTVRELQQSAFELLDRMIAVGKSED